MAVPVVVGVTVAVMVSRLGVSEGPAVVGMIRVRVGVKVVEGVGVGVWDPGANCSAIQPKQ